MDIVLHTVKRMRPIEYQPMGQKSLANFMSHVRRPEDNGEGCWVWFGGSSAKGYGRFKHCGKLYSPHRLAYAQFVAAIPAGMYVCHKCDNGACVRPEHLFLGTCSDNMRDCRDKGRLCSQNAEHIDRIAHLKASSIDAVKSLLRQRISLAAVGRKLGVSKKAVQNFVRRHKLAHQSPWSKKPGRKAVSK